MLRHTERVTAYGVCLLLLRPMNRGITIDIFPNCPDLPSIENALGYGIRSMPTTITPDESGNYNRHLS